MRSPVRADWLALLSQKLTERILVPRFVIRRTCLVVHGGALQRAVWMSRDGPGKVGANNVGKCTGRAHVRNSNAGFADMNVCSERSVFQCPWRLRANTLRTSVFGVDAM